MMSRCELGCVRGNDDGDGGVVRSERRKMGKDARYRRGRTIDAAA